MNFSIRDAKITDMASVLKLIKELAVFEKEENAVIVSVEDLKKAGFSKHPLFKCFVAEINNKIVGMALFYPRYSTWKGPIIHLEDLIVTKSKRGLKIGSELYKKVIAYGYNTGVERIDWNVLDWNTPAINFYKSTGAKVLKDWDTVQIDRLAMRKYLGL